MAVIIDEPPVSIRPIDTCDPWSLQSNKEVFKMHSYINESTVVDHYLQPSKVLSSADICLLAFQTCQSRIILALKNYTRIFHKDGVFISDACSNWREQANKIAEVTGDLLRVLKVYVCFIQNLCYCFNTSFWCTQCHFSRGKKLFPHPHLLSSWKVSYGNVLLYQLL